MAKVNQVPGPLSCCKTTSYQSRGWAVSLIFLKRGILEIAEISSQAARPRKHWKQCFLLMFPFKPVTQCFRFRSVGLLRMPVRVSWVAAWKRSQGVSVGWVGCFGETLLDMCSFILWGSLWFKLVVWDLNPLLWRIGNPLATKRPIRLQTNWRELNDGGRGKSSKSFWVASERLHGQPQKGYTSFCL